MALSCQQDSYLRELSTRVKSCVPARLQTVVNGKKQKLEGFEVVLEDTVLFPEGGGQPDDRGKINSVDVHRVTRRGAEAVHFVQSDLEVNSEVNVTVDWTRRFDHMQQHSAQHLVTAIAEQKYGYKTTSWNLGEKTSFIELDTTSLTEEQLKELEDEVNAKIRASLPMYPRLFESVDDPKIAEVRTRGLPDDHVGPVRVVIIEGIEANMCCGTHVANLSHLQAVKLLSVEKGKKGKCNLVFVAGSRVLQYLGRCYQTEKALNSVFKGPPEEYAELADKMQKNLKAAQKNALTLLRDLAVLEAQKFKTNPERENFFSLHRKEGDNEFMNIIVNEINDENVVLFLTVGDEQGSGMFLLAGPEDTVVTLGPKVSDLLEGKGFGKKGRFQGKANKLINRPKVEELLQEYFRSSGAEK
ncbi:alanyl-tRNA editing protein Aarsd1-B isoform X2 [Lingula anatina]|uniref:Alanyl-tRNA editing protein Aarsd1-B isoform X1 n=1 Tax=Lingula anatina TaxID=7574 RepID=A0A1S3IAS0_LINAN|nr:alanyl-tRNA editing protein Aarsd1-B isoform X1 [Lingula anatina]XP_013394505.1 alanyl-tRNA editing protein Aarsd1-B isoform X2 [Lingula anatina]|eukprot:XP_013394504.1 alanyl-tRNA editing protein Aarsd1-B isoform X1 [Lingula anatina]